MVKEIEKIMRTRNIYILSACLAAVLSCTEFQEETLEVNEAEKVAMTFTASICDETDPETKTVLDGQLGDELRKVLWSPVNYIHSMMSTMCRWPRISRLWRNGKSSLLP